MSRRRKALYLFLGLAVVLGLLAASTIAKVRRGEDLLWIAELWAPAAVLSIGIVTGIEFLIGHPKPKVEAPAPEPVPTAPHAPQALKAPQAVLAPKKAPAKPKAKPATKKSPKK